MNASGSGTGEEIYAYSLKVIRSEEGISFRPSFSLPFDHPIRKAFSMVFYKRFSK